jgi:hypothetical protein
VLVLVLLAIGIFIWCRVRRGRRARGGTMQLSSRSPLDDEESIPLRPTDDHEARANGDDHQNGYASAGVPPYQARVGMSREGKGKAREEEAIFDVGDSDEEK